jgi:hypothetical protein
MKFNQIRSSGSRVVECGQLDATKLVVSLRNIANEPKHKLRKWSVEPGDTYIKYWTLESHCHTLCLCSYLCFI